MGAFYSYHLIQASPAVIPILQSQELSLKEIDQLAQVTGIEDSRSGQEKLFHYGLQCT